MKLIAAGAQICGGRQAQKFQILFGKLCGEIYGMAGQKAFDAVYHAIDSSNLIRMGKSFLDHAV